MSFLLDTNVISEPEQKRPSAKVMKWLEEQDESRLYLSALSIGEIKKGATRLASGAKKAKLQSWLEELRTRFSRRILPITEATFLVWGKMYAEFELKGVVRPAFDSLIEATALEHDLILVTRNVRNFRDSSVTILNPWKD
jgi:predicted nucleic acid-binding protein